MILQKRIKSYLPEKKHLFLLAISWLFIQMIVLLTYGITTNGEATKYLSEADKLLAAQPLTYGKYVFYYIYILFLAFAKTTGIGIAGAYITQLFINGLATVLFYFFIKNRFQNSLTALTGSFLLIICFPFQKWVSFLYTESLFCSLLVILVYLLFHEKTKWKITAIAVLAMAFFTRPTGILLLPVLLLSYLPFILQKRYKIYYAVFLVLAGFLLVPVLNWMMKGGGDFNFMLPFTEGHIICGVPGGTPLPALTLPENGNSIGGLLYFVYHNFSYFFISGCKKMLYYFGMMRPYYSVSHNLYLASFFIPLYVFAASGARKLYRNDNALLWFCVTWIGAFSVIVFFSCDEWSNRFIIPIIPIIIILSLGNFYSYQKEKKSTSSLS
jgi:4-amino-4-deoxy-L-arabinose transferase-like glycosyltransferase